MRRAILSLAMIALATASVLISVFFVSEVSAAGKGMVRFIGYVNYPEAWNDVAMYGSYECFVTVAWVISDAEGFLAVGFSVSACYTVPLGLTIGELVECYGYYYYSEGRKQEVGHCDCGVLPESEYHIIRVSTRSDVNQDLVVDIFDLVQYAGAYGSTPSDQAKWDVRCDVVEPYWIVDIFDVVFIASHYGEEYTH